MTQYLTTPTQPISPYEILVRFGDYLECQTTPEGSPFIDFSFEELINSMYASELIHTQQSKPAERQEPQSQTLPELALRRPITAGDFVNIALGIL
jgi:hypothetical protein